ncbi:DUF2971 domain-containing protein [Arenimonas oryziterrae]|uniref:DUF2971 domain-containing protein n=1 Tax=Arenimonas oryziterrae DSM 21050 = YC6267 TaxID=1121015 RepID=A0A091ASL6_9GAMM|nr:DUF2971 domain-containing protein [Arenimonas oryziterrae]KFN42356.1 hypothetical protein N789_14300 [Arenimonas oryziterrae DSM 21050 = YC6267]
MSDLNEPGVLFHYCSTEAMLAILQSKKVRLSSVLASNDSLEGKVSRGTLIEMFMDQVSDPNLVGEFQKLVAEQASLEGLAFCLSERGDVLSQWRGYADDGRGVAIGFSTNHLRRLSQAVGHTTWFELVEIKYHLHEHREQVQAIIDGVMKVVSDGWGKKIGLLSLGGETTYEEHFHQQQVLRQAAATHLRKLLWTTFAAKPKAFEEEQEWRLLHLMIPDVNFVCEYRASATRAIPFRTVDLFDVPGIPIVEVVLGPKHATQVDEAERMLEGLGYGNVSVKRSIASYR